MIALATGFDPEQGVRIRCGMPDCLLATSPFVEYLRRSAAPGASTGRTLMGLPVRVCEHLPPGVLGQLWRDGLVVLTILEGDE